LARARAEKKIQNLVPDAAAFGSRYLVLGASPVLLREQPCSSVQQRPPQYSFFSPFISFLPSLLITRRFNPPSFLGGSITNKEADPAKRALVDEMVHLPHLGKLLLITRRFNPPSFLGGSITNKEADPAKRALVDEMVHLPHLGKLRREVKEEVMDADGASAAAEASPFHKRSRVSQQHQVGSPVFQFPFPSNISWFMHMNLSRTNIGGKGLFLK
jgi:hypothetical protein